MGVFASGIGRGVFFGAASVLTYFLIKMLLAFVPLNPFCERIYCWETGFHFLLGPAGLFLYVTYRLLSFRFADRVGNSKRSIYAVVALYGISAGMILLFFFSMTIHRSERIDWGHQVNDPSELLNTLQAEHSGRPFLLFFHADWCSSCDDFERYVVGSRCAEERISEYSLIRIDVTDFEKWHHTMEAYTGESAVPAASFLDRNRRRVPVSFTGDHVSVNAFCSALQSIAAESRGEPDRSE